MDTGDTLWIMMISLVGVSLIVSLWLVVQVMVFILVLVGCTFW